MGASKEDAPSFARTSLSEFWGTLAGRGARGRGAKRVKKAQNFLKKARRCLASSLLEAGQAGREGREGREGPGGQEGQNFWQKVKKAEKAENSLVLSTPGPRYGKHAPPGGAPRRMRRGYTPK